MNKAGAIIRVSTVKQLDGTSPDKQLVAIQTLASEQGYIIEPANIWKLAESGNLIDREGFRNALEAVTAGKVSRVFVFNVDRLGRNSLEMMLFLRDMGNSDIECWAAESKKVLKWDDFIFQIEAAVASKERQEIIKRTSDGMERAIRRGQFSGGIIAYGYRFNPETKALEVDDEEAKVIKLIFSWTVDEQISTIKIANRLNAMGIPTRYKKDGRKIFYKGKRAAEHTAGIWRAGRILNMMKNTAYMGVWEYGKRSKKRKPENRIKTTCPAIVTPDVFKKAQQVMSSHRISQDNKPTRKYLLRGLIKCELCGLTFIGTYYRTNHVKGKEKRYYVCDGRHSYLKLGKPKCENPYLKASELEDAVWEDVKFYCENPEVAIHQLRENNSTNANDVILPLDEIEKQIREIERQKKNILELSIKSKEVDSESVDALLSENKASLKSLQVYKEQLQNRMSNSKRLEEEIQSVADRLASLQGNIENATYEEKFKAVSALVKSITVNKNKVGEKDIPVVTITYRFNDPESLPAFSPSVSAILEDCTLTDSWRRLT
ncbi:MAG: recombinase family protein [Anaerolineales bacterium]